MGKRLQQYFSYFQQIQAHGSQVVMQVNVVPEPLLQIVGRVGLLVLVVVMLPSLEITHTWHYLVMTLTVMELSMDAVVP